MKKLLLLLLFVPSVALAKVDCAKIYDLAYDLMIARQSNVPMPKIMNGIDKIEESIPELKTSSEGRWFMAEFRKMVERAYMMPNMSFMETAAHTMAAEFANHQYLRCTRAQRK